MYLFPMKKMHYTRVFRYPKTISAYMQYKRVECRVGLSISCCA